MHPGFGSRIIGLTRLAFCAVHRRDIDDAAPTFFHHVGDHLLGHVEHRVQVGLDHHVPVLTAHFQEHAVARNTGVVHQHIDHAMLGLGLGKGFHGGVPIADIARRCVKGVAQCRLFANPLDVVTGGATTCDDFKTFFVQALANGGTDSTHTTGNVSNFLTHDCLLFINKTNSTYYQINAQW